MKHKKKKQRNFGSRLLSWFLVLLVALGLFQLSGPAKLVQAAVGDTPAHSKTLIDNGDGTYTLSLDVVGDSEKQPNNVNVIVIFDRSGSMNNQRMTAAKTAVNNLANSLFAYNTSSEPNTVQMALVSFSTNATIANNMPTNNAATFRNAVNGLSADGGTNWEDALDEAGNVNFGDDDQTFVIFVSDGNPTFRNTRISTDYLPRSDNSQWNNNQTYNYYRGDDIYYSSSGVYGLGSDNSSQANYSPTSMTRCYDAAVPKAKAIVNAVGDDHFFTIGAYGDVSRMQTLTTAAGAPEGNFYNATDTAALNQALADILAKIEMMGIADVEVGDGTTNQVTTSSGDIAELLEVDTSSFKYYRSGGSHGTNEVWSDAPEAEFVNGEVQWDLSSVGVLENGVKYTVTFDCYPSQYTYDLIASLKNHDIAYGDTTKYPAEIWQYIVNNGNDSYSLLTNTSAKLTYDDTRDEAGKQTREYDPPQPVSTDAAPMMTVAKEWEGGDPDVDSLDVTVLMDGESFHTATLSTSNNWKAEFFISVGLIKDGQVLSGSEGHDFTLAELGSEQYHWELDAPTVRPMLIDGGKNNNNEPNILIKVDESHPAPSGATTYTIEGSTYYVATDASTSLTATNHRRSNLNLTKVVTGEDAPADTKFPFELTVNNSKAPSTAPSEEEDPDHESDYWIWLSVRDENGQRMEGLDLGTGVIEDGNGYYYAPNGTKFSIEIGAGWSLRFLNLPTGSTYTFTEGTLPAGFAFNKAELTTGEDSTFSGGQTTKGTIENTKTSYSVKFTNDYQLADIEITKEWADASNQDGYRLTADELKEKLTLNPAVEGKEPTVVDNGDNTFTITYTGLPRFNNGTEVTYTVAEAEIDHYTTTGSPAEDHGTITNSHTPEKTSVTVTKVWDDSNNIGNIRPDSVEVQLYADGTVSGEPVTLNAGNEWTYTWQNLDKFVNGTEIAYTVDETAVPAGYTEQGPDKNDNGEWIITNTYTPTPVKVDPPVQKIITNNDALYNNGAFTFTIESTSAPEGVTAPMPENTSITNSATYELEGKKGYYEFGEIEFTVPGTYVYTVKESGSVDGVTNDPAAAEGKTITFTVTDAGGDQAGTLVVSPTTDQVELSFTNTYDADGEATIVVNKQIAGAAWPEGKELTFTITGAEGAPMPATTTATRDAVGSVTFGPIQYALTDAGKTYTYTISENGFGDGWTGSGDVTATVEVIDNGDGTLGTTVTYSPENATITNTYKATGTATIEAFKALSGAAWPTNQDITLAFTLAAATEGAPMPANSEVAVTAAGKVSFGDITYTEADAGKTYTYTITETTKFGEGWTASDPITATVVVTDNGDGTLATSVTYDNNDTITNTYVASGEAVLEVNKELKGAAWPSGQELTFSLAGEGGTLPTATTKKATEAGKVTFDAITYTEADAGNTYTYTISEDGFGEGWTGSGVVTATVEVIDNGDGTLATNVTYDNADTIINTYVASGEAVLEANKVIAGAAWPAGKTLTFTLAGEGGTLPEATTKTLAAAGKVTFDAITYSQDDIDPETGTATYTYTISEDGFGSGWTSSGNVTATVVVTDNGDGTLGTTVTYSPDNATITNTYKANGSVVLTANKNLTGRAWKEGETVTFTLLGPDGTKIEDKTIGENGTVSFTAINYNEADAGNTYKYTISETSTLPGGVTKSADITATVTVTDNGDGTLTATATYDNDDTIINTYVAEPVKAQINVSKTIQGYVDGGDSTFDFTMTGPNIEGSLTTSITTSNGVGGPASFTPIEFTFDDMVDDAGNRVTTKDFTYTVTETQGSAAGFTYDTTSYPVVVTVTDDQNGHLTVADIYKAGTTESHVNVVNTFQEESIDVTLHVDKVIEDLSESAQDTTFTFQLMEGDTVIRSVDVTTNNLTGGADFAPITYTAAGTYNYTLKELIPEETNEGWTYDTKEYPVVITVSDNFDTAQLEASVTIDGTATTSLSVTNKYQAASTEATLQVTKIVDDTSGSAPETTFTFTLAAEEGTPMPENNTASVTGSGTASFDKITYTTAGTFNYTITETAGGGDGWVNDNSAYPAVVTVTDVEGKLVADVAYTKGAESVTELTVTNIYDPKDATAAPQARKVVDDQSNSAPNETFSFQLIDKATGEVVEIKTRENGGYVYFSELTFSKTGVYSYTIQEQAGETIGFDYDSAPYDFTIDVTDEGKGELVAKIIYPDDEIVITNPYKAKPAELTLDVTKVVEGLPEGAAQKDFTFTLTGVDGAPMPAATEATVTGSASTSFGPITYETAGTYTYTISEKSGDAKGYTYDTAVYTVTVDVKDNGGQLVAGPTIEKDGEYSTTIYFINNYKAESTTIQLTAKKDLEGRDLAEGEFEFELAIDGKETVTAKNAADGSISFSPVTFEEAGEFNFKISEVKGSLVGVTYDETVYEGTIVITDDGEGKLKGSIETDATAITFTNIYKPGSATVDLSGKKVLTGRDLAEGEFEFELTVDDKVVETVKNAKDGSITFSTLTFEEAGEHTYKVVEIKGKADGITYDETVYEGTITVTDNGEGKLEAAIDGKDITFTNKYTAPPVNPPAPPTGDPTNLLIWLFIMLAAAVGFTSLMAYKRRRI